MRIRRLTAFQTSIALKKPIRHASHTRTHNDTLLIRCELGDGSVGWGEGLPRPYVTGESIGSVWRHLTSTDFECLADGDYGSPAAAQSSLEQLQLADVRPDGGQQPRDCFGNAVRCALEIAVLDAACRAAACSLGDWVHAAAAEHGIANRTDIVRYSGVVTSTGAIRQWRSALKMRLFGFRQIKVKVGATGVDDAHLLQRMRFVVGQGVDVRADANEAWQPDELPRRAAVLRDFGITSLEQPLPHADVSNLAQLRPDIGIPVMLDESLCSVTDGQRAIADRTCDAFNLRLSKCGGMSNCIRLAHMAHSHGLIYQLGCQVGETGILSAAGRHFACNVADIRYLEGSYDRFLIRDRLTQEDLTFRFGGRATRLSGPGLGITVDESAIRQKSVRTENLI